MIYNSQIKEKLDFYHDKYNREEFIKGDPISIPHLFTKIQDIEIAALLTSVIAWGRRTMIINNASKLMDLMDNSPFEFIINHLESDRKRFLDFKHRTFQTTDILYFLEFLQWYYQNNVTLENAFLAGKNDAGFEMKLSLEKFHNLFFSMDTAPHRTKKHIPTPVRKSTCKRLNMFLRWMVRNDDRGVDFGLWKKIKPSELMIPIDVHVERYARKFGLLERKQRDWQAVEELTSNLRLYDPDDPVKYDFALFGIGVMEGENE
ncbi:MAG: TIGR02757 family protein [Deltaproteobacteria bacterium]